MRRRMLLLVSILLSLLVALPAAAQAPVVYGIFFYSPRCGHCHEVIENHWPGIQQEFGDQLVVLFIDASQVEGAALMRAAGDVVGRQLSGVPTLIIGADVLVGSVDIPQRAPDVIRAGLAAGGVALPPIPGIDALYASIVQGASAQADATAAAEETPAPLTAARDEGAPSLRDRLLADPAGNAAAIGVLALLVASLLVLGLSALGVRMGTRAMMAESRGYGARIIVGAVSVVGIGLGLSLVLGAQDALPVLLLGAAVLAAFALLVLAVVTTPSARPLPRWSAGVMLLAGIGVAAYMTYVETTLSDAVCGAIGNCNAVQQSPYAALFGIPIGVIGVAGYACLALLWVGQRRWPGVASPLLMALTLFGVAFSTYLTFLEPFVIGASCAWCLTSAVIMLNLMWLASMEKRFNDGTLRADQGRPDAGGEMTGMAPA